MDNLTHSLVGALIGQAGLKRKTGLAMPALIIGANIADIDGACMLLGDMQHLALRRGITHGPIAWVVLPLVLAGLLYAYDRWQAQERFFGRGKRPEKRLPVRFGWLFVLALVGYLTHPALDWMNNYGVRLLEPFSSRWFYGDILFIIDIWLWVGLGFATWFSLRREKRGGEWRRPARIALVAMLAYIGVNWGITAYDRAVYASHMTPGSRFISSPVPFAFWQRDQIMGRYGEDWYIYRSQYPGGPIGGQQELVPPGQLCLWPDMQELQRKDPDLSAFLFWSRAPFAERHPNGSGVVLRDARFYNRQLRGGAFAVELPHIPCEPHR